MYRPVALVTCLALPFAVQAEVELSFYGGLQSSPHSIVSITGDSVLADEEFRAGWVGDSLAAPPYYGFRATWWQGNGWGYGVDLNHAKVYADAETLTETGFERLEFSDGLNILTVNAYRQMPFRGMSGYYYAGAGLGIAVPHVELFEEGSRTFGYQYTGPAVTWMAGISVPWTDTWSVFGEYKGTYSVNEAELETGGTLSTNIVTNALNIGVSFRY